MESAEIEKQMLEKLIEYKSLAKEAERQFQLNDYKMPLDHIVMELQRFYKAALGKISLNSSTINKYKRGWLLHAEEVYLMSL